MKRDTRIASAAGTLVGGGLAALVGIAGCGAGAPQPPFPSPPLPEIAWRPMSVTGASSVSTACHGPTRLYVTPQGLTSVDTSPWVTGTVGKCP